MTITIQKQGREFHKNISLINAWQNSKENNWSVKNYWERNKEYNQNIMLLCKLRVCPQLYSSCPLKSEKDTAELEEFQRATRASLT